MPFDVKCCACGIAAADCEYHNPASLPVTCVTPSGGKTKTGNWLVQMIVLKDFEYGGTFFRAGQVTYCGAMLGGPVDRFNSYEEALIIVSEKTASKWGAMIHYLPVEEYA